MFEHYDKARVFVLTARHKGLAFALVEAAYLMNYIMSTDVSGDEAVLDYTRGDLLEPEGDDISEVFVSEHQMVVSL